MSQSFYQEQLQRLVELFNAETSATNPIDGSTSTSSLSSVLSSLPSSTLDLIDSNSLPHSTTTSLQSQLRCVPSSTYQHLIDIVNSITALPTASLHPPPWTVLSPHSITARPLVALLSFQVRHLSAHALMLSSLYFTLLTLPQPPLHLWNESMVRQIFALLAKWATQKQSGRADVDRKGKKGHRREVEEDSSGDEDDAMEAQGEPAGVNDEAVSLPLRSLLSFLSTFSLHSHADVKSTVMEGLIALTRTQSDDRAGDTPHSLAWSALRSLCEPLHGEPSTAWNLVLKALLPNSLLSFVHCTSPTPPLPLRLVAQSTTSFILSAPSSSLLLPYLQHVSLSTPDRSEYRRCIAQSTVDVLLAQPNVLSPFIPFLLRLSRNAKAGVRMTAIELAAGLVRRVQAGDITAGVIQAGIGLLMARCSDKSPLVRSRALVEVGRCLEEGDRSEEVRAAITALLDEEGDEEISPITRRSLVLSTPNHRQSHFSLATPLDLYTPATEGSGSVSLLNTPMTGPTVAPSIGLQSLLHLLHRRCADGKAGVRRASLVTLTVLLLLHRTSPSFLPSISLPSLQCLYDSCQDQSVLVRKQAMLSLTQIASSFDADPVVGQVWLGAVLPLVEDSESGVRDRAVQCVRELIVERVEEAMKGGGRAVWQLLAALDEAMGHLMRVAIARILQQGDFPAGLLRALNRELAESQESGVWLLMDAVSRQHPTAVDVSSVLAAWERVAEGQVMEDSSMVRMLSVMAQVASLIETRDSHRMTHRLHERLRDLQRAMSANVIKAHIGTLSALYKAHPASKTAQSWEAQLMEDGERVLEGFVLHSQTAAVDTEEVVVRCLFTVGEIALVRSTQTQRFLGPVTSAGPCNRLFSPYVFCMFCVQRGNVKVSGPLLTFIQSLTAPTLSLPVMAVSSPASSTFTNHSLPHSIRAHAFIALGKLCLRDQTLSKRSTTSLHSGAVVPFIPSCPP